MKQSFLQDIWIFFPKSIKNNATSGKRKKNPVAEFDPKRQVFKHSFQGVAA